MRYAFEHDLVKTSGMKSDGTTTYDLRDNLGLNKVSEMLNIGLLYIEGSIDIEYVVEEMMSGRKSPNQIRKEVLQKGKND